jgi:hypothetical protein
MLAEETKTLLSGIVTNLPDLFAQRGDSLPEYTRTTRNDFLTLVENDLLYLDYLPDVLDRGLSLISGYFLSAATLLVDVPEINVKRVLDKLAVKRDPIESILGSGAAIYKFVGTESLEYGLPSSGPAYHGSIAAECFALEADKVTEELKREQRRLRGEQITEETEVNVNVNQNVNVDSGKGDGKKGGGGGFGRNDLKTIDELSNLSTGKMLELTLERNGNKITVPLTIRLAVTNTDQESMKTIVSAAGVDNTFSTRWRRMRNGDLSFVKDLLFCHDLVAEARRARVRDKSGFYEHMMRRRNRNFLSGLFSLSPSINNASAFLVMSQETADEAAFHFGDDLDNFKVREKVFASTAAMIMAVVDTKWDTVTFYHRSVDASNTLSKSDLKRASKGANNNVEDIVKAYQAGNAPVI